MVYTLIIKAIQSIQVHCKYIMKIFSTLEK